MYKFTTFETQNYFCLELFNRPRAGERRFSFQQCQRYFHLTRGFIRERDVCEGDSLENKGKTYFLILEEATFEISRDEATLKGIR